MNWKATFRNISILTLLIITACTNNPNTTNTNTTASPTQMSVTSVSETLPATADAQTVVPTVATDTLCGNAYYPVREGTTWTYQSSGSPAGNYSFTDTISSVRTDGFTLTSTFEGVTRTQEWSCTLEGLVALQMGGPAAAALNAQDMELLLDVKNVSGVTFPKNIDAGDEWQHTLDFEGQMGLAGQTGEASGSAVADFRAIGIESVSVSAGTFDAMKIQVDTTVTISVTYQGLNVPVTFTGTYAYWFAPNVGWVKASGTGAFAGQTFTENIELQSYTVP